MEEQSVSIQSIPDLTVVGLGPGGLSACIEAARLGMHVLALTKKQAYVRGQRFKQTSHTISFLDSLEDLNDIEDEKFFNKMVEDNSIQIKDLEKFLRRKLELYSHLVTIIELEEDNPIIAIQENSDTKATYLYTQNGTRYYFTNLLGADGIKRRVSRLLRDDLSVPIFYERVKEQDRYLYHASVQLFKSPSSTPTLLNSSLQIEKLWEPLLGPEKDPLALILTNRMGTNVSPNKFSYTGEIPKLIFEATGLNQVILLKEWAIAQICKEYTADPYLASQLEFRTSKKYEHSKDKVKTSTFELQITVCNQAFFALSNGYYAPIGDARRTPNYKIAHGLHDAILEGIEFVRCIEHDNFNELRYQAVINNIDNSLKEGDLYWAPEYKLDPRTIQDPSVHSNENSENIIGVDPRTTPDSSVHSSENSEDITDYESTDSSDESSVRKPK